MDGDVQVKGQREAYPPSRYSPPSVFCQSDVWMILIYFFSPINCCLLIVFVASQCAFGVDVSDRRGSDRGDVSVRREEDWPVGGANGPGGRSQDGVAERWALKEVMVVVVVWMGRGGGRAES